MSVRDIQAHLRELYGVEVGHDVISRVTDAVLDDVRDVLGLWFQRSECAKFWLAVLNELKQRGVQDVLICCVPPRLQGPTTIGPRRAVANKSMER